MASFCYLCTASLASRNLAIVPQFVAYTSSLPSTSQRCSCSVVSPPMFSSNPLVSSNRMAQRQMVRMAQEEEKLTRRNPLDFPIHNGKGRQQFTIGVKGENFSDI